MNLFTLSAVLGLETSAFDRGVNTSTSKGQKLASTLQGGFSALAKGAAVASGVVVAMGAGLNALEAETREYRESQAKTNTAMEQAGFGADTAKKQYQDFYAILGDTGQATEATQLLSKMATSQEELGKWTNISTGIVAEFGDSLPVESLIEAANETANVGKVTGSLADALTWVGVSEDEFNAKLSTMTTEQERNAYITQTLNGLYAKSADAYRENNKEIIKANENQAKMTDTMADVSDKVLGIKNKIIDDLMPALSGLGEFASETLGEMSKSYSEDGFSGMIDVLADTLETALVTVVEALPGMLETVVPQFLEFAFSLVERLAVAIAEATPALITSAFTIIQSLVNGLAEAAPGIIKAVTEIILFLATGLTNPNEVAKIIDAALFLASSIFDGIIDAIPKIVEAIPTVIENILTIFKENYPKMLEMGVSLFTKLIENMPEAISNITEKLPSIITGIIDTIVELLPQIVDAGMQLFTALIENMPQIIVEIVKIIPQIVSSIVDGFTDLFPEIVDVGANLIRGLWNGMKSMGTWVGDKVSGFFGGIVDNVKATFGIASPSKVFKEFGKFTVQGFGLGMEDEKENLDGTTASVFDIANMIPAPENLFANSGMYSSNRNEEEKTPLTVEAVLQTLLAGFAGVATSVFDAIPKEQTIEINGEAVARATWDDFAKYAGERGRIFAPTRNEIASIAMSVMPRLV